MRDFPSRTMFTPRWKNNKRCVNEGREGADGSVALPFLPAGGSTCVGAIVAGLNALPVPVEAVKGKRSNHKLNRWLV